ncbi:MAG TPA: phosphomannomutase/phosphoglucomutase [Candidatus Binatia bacterium]|nr:phosphomannomutase/phosphoglucomutase [Candidatus Binatia bacterium]
MKLDPTIFREYDIRGVAERDMDADFARALGRAVATRIRKVHPDRTPAMSVGRDCRLTSDAYADAVIAGIAETGVDVVDIGMCPTPLLYFSLFRLPVDGGIEVTASHNASEYNGFKVCIGRESAYGESIARLRGEIERADFASGRGGVRKHPMRPEYHAYCVEQFGTLARRLRVVVDGGNGATGPVAPPILREIGCDVIELYCDPDGRFPNHHPDPTVPKNLADLVRAVDAKGADVGIAFDGDGDRIGVVAPGGSILWGDELLVIFAREILARKPGSVVISEVKCSQRLFDDVAKHGGKPIMWKAGHSLIKAKMKETHAEVGGEMSGHMFFADRFFGFDDATYAACRLLEILARSSGGVADLIADLPPAFATPEIRVDCPDEIKFAVADRVRERLARDFPVNDVDGVRVTFDDGWGLVRASNTQPALVLRFEASKPEKVEEHRHRIEALVAEVRREVESSS